MAKTIAQTFQELGVKDHKDRDSLATEMVSTLAKNGVTETKKGNKVSKELVLRQINAMLRDIKQDGGQGRKGWWSTFNVVDEKNKFKIVKKA